ncbi:MAG: hypothetical protein BWY25_02259 [Chloroflexi bacterium ADurb.Bin222]|nr:MAG: hypothetical protein BWY25_02259 [Chloroflexi bacterium ADurb.Bin222]
MPVGENSCVGRGLFQQRLDPLPNGRVGGERHEIRREPGHAQRQQRQHRDGEDVALPRLQPPAGSEQLRYSCPKDDDEGQIRGHEIFHRLRGAIRQGHKRVNEPRCPQGERGLTLAQEEPDPRGTDGEQRDGGKLKAEERADEGQAQRQIGGVGEGEHVAGEALGQHVMPEARPGVQARRRQLQTLDGSAAQRQVELRQTPGERGDGDGLPPAARLPEQRGVAQQQVQRPAYGDKGERGMMSHTQPQRRRQAHQRPGALSAVPQFPVVLRQREEAPRAEEQGGHTDVGGRRLRPEGGGTAQQSCCRQSARQRGARGESPGLRPQAHRFGDQQQGRRRQDGAEQVEAEGDVSQRRQAHPQRADHRVQRIAGRVKDVPRGRRELKFTAVRRQHIAGRGRRVEREEGQPEQGERETGSRMGRGGEGERGRLLTAGCWLLIHIQGLRYLIFISGWGWNPQPNWRAVVASVHDPHFHDSVVNRRNMLTQPPGAVSYSASSRMARSRMRSAVNPKCSCSTAPGADAPKR